MSLASQIAALATRLATEFNNRDAVGAALVAGSGVTITVNDPADTITIAATSTGSGLTAPQVAARVWMGA